MRFLLGRWIRGLGKGREEGDYIHMHYIYLHYHHQNDSYIKMVRD